MAGRRRQGGGILRQYERDNDGTWHDALMMDMLARDLTS